MRWGLVGACAFAAALLWFLVDKDRVTHWTIDPSTRLEVRTREAVPTPLNLVIHGTLELDEDRPERSTGQASVAPRDWRGEPPITFEPAETEADSPSSLRIHGTLTIQGKRAPITVHLDVTEPPTATRTGPRMRRATAVTELDPADFGAAGGITATVSVHLVLVEDH